MDDNTDEFPTIMDSEAPADTEVAEILSVTRAMSVETANIVDVSNISVKISDDPTDVEGSLGFISVELDLFGVSDTDDVIEDGCMASA